MSLGFYGFVSSSKETCGIPALDAALQQSPDMSFDFDQYLLSALHQAIRYPGLLL
jgi:hypothetical protein